MSSRTVRICFLGVGSIGSLFGGYLMTCKLEGYTLEVTFICRKNHAEAIQKSGLKIQRNDNIQEIQGIKAYWTLEGSDFEDELFDYLFLCTKTYDIESVLVQYKNLIDLSKWLVILQNGIGNEDIIKKYYSEEHLMRIITSNGALLKEPGFVIHTGLGYTKLGLVVPRMKTEAQKDLLLLCNLLRTSSIKTEISENIIKDCWEKVFVNIGINPFGALTRLRNGKLLESDGLKRLMAEAVKEAVIVANQKRIDLSDKDYVELMFDVAEKTKNNKNSMLQDVLKGKNTEIDFMNGSIVKYAKELGIAVPINELLTYLIKGLEISFS